MSVLNRDATMIDAFLAELLGQRSVRHAAMALPPGLDWATAFASIPQADRQGSVRILAPDGPLGGHAKADVARQLSLDGDWTDASWRAVFAGGRYSLAVESFEQWHPELAAIAEALRTLTGCRVIATAIFAPARHKGTAIHYDNADVLALQLHGAKRWRLFAPIDPEPNARTPFVRLPPEADLTPGEDVLLRAGEALFLPRGWIHDVANEGDAPSLHVSMVIFADSLLSVFGNAMTQAYAQLCLEERWRAALGTAAPPRADVEAMLDAFRARLLAALDDEPERLRDHVANHAALAAARAAARMSQTVLADGDTGVVLRWVAGQHRAVLNRGVMEVSTDGKNTAGLDPQLYALCRERGTLSLHALQRASGRSAEQVARFALTAVGRLGLLDAQRP